MRYFLFALMLVPSAALADGCPVAPDHDDLLSDLIRQAQAAPTQGKGLEIGSQMWQLWAEAPDEASQAMLDSGMSKRRVADYLGAIDDFNRLVDYCPHYAEGYNQRAFVNYLLQNYSTALADLDMALSLSPRHVAAIAGRALTLLALDRIDEARVALAEALELNPWLNERGLAAAGGPLAPAGKDL